MGENAKNAENAKKANSTPAPKKKSWWKGLKAEFAKIVWPSKNTITKETIAVVVATAVLAVLITGLDFVFQFGIDKLLSWK